MRCQKCGHNLPEYVKYCTNCGAPMLKETETNRSMNSSNINRKSGRKNNTGIIIVYESNY